MSAKHGILYLIPNFLGPAEPGCVFPPYNARVLKDIDYFIAEREKAARRLIKALLPEKNQARLHFFELNRHTDPAEIKHFLNPLLAGHPMGLMSEAGLPGIADPGAKIVHLAHRQGIRVKPLVGPSSIFLALMASGLNGQRFAFHGYLPVKTPQLSGHLRRLESRSRRNNETQIFIETPYRNDKMLNILLQTLHPDTLLCVATDLTLETEWIATRRIAEWIKEPKPRLHKRPAIFLFLAE